jgi:hypothetical protein
MLHFFGTSEGSRRTLAVTLNGFQTIDFLVVGYYFD